MRWLPAAGLLAAAIAWYAVARAPGPPLLLLAGAVLAHPARSVVALKLIRGYEDVAPLSPPPLMAYVFTPLALGVGLLVDHARLAWIFALVVCGLGVVGYAIGWSAWALRAKFTRGKVSDIVGPIDGDKALLLDEVDTFRTSGYGRTASVTSNESYTVSSATSFAIGSTVVQPKALAWWSSHAQDKRRWIAANDEVALAGTTLLAAPPGEDPLAQLNAIHAYWLRAAFGLLAVAAATIITRS